MDGLKAEAFFADKAYDTNELLDMLKEADIAAVILRLKAGKSRERTATNCIGHGTSLKTSSAPSSTGGESLRKACRFLYCRHSCQMFVSLPSSPHCLVAVSVPRVTP